MGFARETHPGYDHFSRKCYLGKIFTDLKLGYPKDLPFGWGFEFRNSWDQTFHPKPKSGFRFRIELYTFSYGNQQMFKIFKTFKLKFL